MRPQLSHIAILLHVLSPVDLEIARTGWHSAHRCGMHGISGHLGNKPRRQVLVVGKCAEEGKRQVSHTTRPRCPFASWNAPALKVVTPAMSHCYRRRGCPRPLKATVLLEASTVRGGATRGQRARPGASPSLARHLRDVTVDACVCC